MLPCHGEIKLMKRTNQRNCTFRNIKYIL